MKVSDRYSNQKRNDTNIKTAIRYEINKIVNVTHYAIISVNHISVNINV